MEIAMAELKKVKASMMNAIHDLPLLVARDEGFFRDEGLDVEVLTTPGSGQHNSDDRALKDDIFKRTMEALYDKGECDQFRMCEWGIMKRAVEAGQDKDLRKAKIVALGSAMSSFAIVVDPRSGIYEPEQLKNESIAVSQFNGSHFTMLKMMEGFIKRDEIKIANHGTHRQRLDAVKAGKVKAASLQEPWISVAEAQGARVIIESRSTRSEAAGDEMDGPTLAKMFRAEARAAEAIQKSPEKYAHYILEEAGGLIGMKDLKLSRILNAPPTPYTRERFNDNYQWTLGWGLVPPGATYESTVDNRAWQ
jgi:NitT/TauT family transport system substrate-binding protein